MTDCASISLAGLAIPCCSKWICKPHSQVRFDIPLCQRCQIWRSRYLWHLYSSFFGEWRAVAKEPSDSADLYPLGSCPGFHDRHSSLGKL